VAQEVDPLLREVGDAMDGAGRRVAVAESLTGGEISARLACVPGSGEWFRGGVVAYASEVKYTLLEVPEGPVVSGEAAAQMAATSARLLGADLVVAVTGVAGPEEQEGKPPGTVWIALEDRGHTELRQEHFDGPPDEVVNATCDVTLRWLLERCSSSGSTPR
jgi:nicotinamide-nucleotide amidase